MLTCLSDHKRGINLRSTSPYGQQARVNCVGLYYVSRVKEKEKRNVLSEEVLKSCLREQFNNKDRM
jgi:hypothetical protein